MSALTAFSALVAVSVAVSSGIDPAADIGAERTAGAAQGAAFGVQGTGGQRPDAQWSVLAAGLEPQPPGVPLGNGRSLSPVRDGATGDGSWREGAGRGDGGSTSSTVRPGRHAPALYDGELPVNTIIAPTSPGAVLHGGAFGWRTAPDRGGREFHNGTDISAAAGLPVVAALDGEVTAVFWDEWGGNRVEVSHADGMTTTYSHLEDVRVETGDRLAASEQLGSVGSTGVRVTGPHLHFETWIDGEAVDPQSFDWVDGIHVIPASRGKYSLEVPASADERGKPVRTRKEEAVRKPPATRVAAPSEPQAEQERQQPARPAQGSPAPVAPAPEAPAVAPVPVVPVVEPAPVVVPVTEPAPVAEPVVTEPVVAEPAPVVEPVVPEPVVTEPVVTEPAPVVEPVVTEPVVTEPVTEPVGEPVVPEPVVTEPAPVVEPVATEPAPAPAPVEPDAGTPENEPGVAPVAVPDTERDTDGDGILDVVDPDLDGDGIPDELDDDLDGDGITDDVDPDLDGDALRNEEDPDADGDGLLNGDDEQPLVPAAKTAPSPQPAGPEPAA